MESVKAWFKIPGEFDKIPPEKKKSRLQIVMEYKLKKQMSANSKSVLPPTLVKRQASEVGQQRRQISDVIGQRKNSDVLSNLVSSESQGRLSSVMSNVKSTGCLPVSHLIDPTAQINKMEALMATRAMVVKNNDINIYFSGHSREKGADWACATDWYITPDDINELCENRTNLTIYLDCNYAELWADRFQQFVQ